MWDLLKLLFGSNLDKKGVIMGYARNENHFFRGRNNKQIMSFQKLFIISKYHMFWLSYESFSMLGDVFLSKKCHFQLKQLGLFRSFLLWGSRSDFITSDSEFYHLLERDDEVMADRFSNSRRFAHPFFQIGCSTQCKIEKSNKNLRLRKQ